MDRDSFEKMARTLAEQIGGSFPTVEHAYDWLQKNGVVPTLMPRTRAYEEAREVYGAHEVPVVTRRQRQHFASDHGWSDPEEIAYVSVAETKNRRFVVYQSTEGGVEIYVYNLDAGTESWTIETPRVIC